MSSFATDHIYCEKCFNVVKNVLIDDKKYLCSTQIIVNGASLPIIAGKIGGNGFNSEISRMNNDLIPRIECEICHPLRIAVLLDCGDSVIFNIKPISKGKERHK